jgi:hypothetical protein
MDQIRKAPHSTDRNWKINSSDFWFWSANKKAVEKLFTTLWLDDQFSKWVEITVIVEKIREYSLEKKWVIETSQNAREPIKIEHNLEAQQLAKKLDLITEEKIKLYQKNHFLSENWIITLETFAELKSESTVEKALDRIEKLWISIKTLTEIKVVLPTLKFWSKNYTTLNFLVNNFNSWQLTKTPEQQELINDILKTNQNRINSPEWVEAQTALEENKDSIYALLKSDKSPAEKAEALIKNPTLLMIWGLLFLFGVIWWDTKYTNSFMKRIGWVLWWALLWPKLWKELWWSEIISDISNVSSKVAKNISETAATSKSKVIEFFKKDVPQNLQGIWDFDFSNIWTKIGEKYDSVTSWFNTYNETLKTEDWEEKAEFIKEKPLVALTWLISDEIFLNLSDIDLWKIKNKASLNDVITDDTKTKLNAAGVSDADIKNFIENHLLENAFVKETEAVLVKDLLFTTSMKKTFDSFIDDWEYISDEVANEEISNKLSTLRNSLNPKNRNLWLELSKSIKSWKIEDFKIENFTWISKEAKDKAEEIIKKVKSFNTEQKEINLKISEIEKINPVSTKNLQKETLEEYLDVLEKIKLDLTKVSSFHQDKFNNAVSDKKNQIFNWAEENSILVLTVSWTDITVADETTKLEKAKKVTEDKKTLKNIEIKDIPDSSKTPIEFKEWYNRNSSSFEIAKTFKTDTNSDIKKLATDILKEKAKFKKNYKAMKARYIIKLSTIDEIENITDLTKYLENREILKNQKEKLEEFSKEVVEWITINDFKDFYNRIRWEYVPISFKNIFENLDWELVSSTPKPNVEVLALQNRDRIYTIEELFDTTIDWTSLDIKINSTIIAYVKELKSKLNIISTFSNTDLKEEKVKLLEIETKKLSDLYLGKINTETDPKKLKKLYDHYEVNVEKPLGWMVISIMKIFKDGKVKIAYEEKLEELNPKNLKTALELVPELKEWGLWTFLDTYKEDNIIKAINWRFRRFKWDTKIIEIKQALEWVQKVYNGNKEKEQLLSDLVKVLDKVNKYLDN